MKITVEYAAQLKQAVDLQSEIFQFKTSCTIPVLIDSIASRHGDKVKKMLVDEKGNLRPSFVIAVNGKQSFVESPQHLGDGDTVMIISPMAGG